MRCGLVAILVTLLLPFSAMAADDLPKRLWEEPPGVRTLETRAPDEEKPTGNFVMGFQPQVEVTGTVTAPASPEFVMKVRDKWPNCDLSRLCGNYAYVDCGSAMDGPAYYIDSKTLDIIAECGGACMNPDQPCNCPPKEWTCNQTQEGPVKP